MSDVANFYNFFSFYILFLEIGEGTTMRPVELVSWLVSEPRIVA